MSRTDTTPGESTLSPDAQDAKVTAVFGGKVVRKDLVRKVKVGANVPVFVLEYLLGKYCATDDPFAIEAGLRVVNSMLAENFVRPDEANRAQSRVKERGQHTLIDKVKVRSLAEALQVGMENGARRALVPLEIKRHFLEVTGEVMERVDPVFYGDPMTAAVKALGLT